MRVCARVRVLVLLPPPPRNGPAAFFRGWGQWHTIRDGVNALRVLLVRNEVDGDARATETAYNSDARWHWHGAEETGKKVLVGLERLEAVLRFLGTK